MNTLVRLANRLYLLLLRLHPLAREADFYEEMAATWTQVIEETSSRNARAVWLRILRELFDLPGVIVRSWIFGRKAMTENPTLDNKSSPPTPWGTALLSLLPFVWLGPVMLALSYLSFWADLQWGAWLWIGRTLLVVVILAGGILLGLKHGFPRWSYPYVMGCALFLTSLVNYLLRFSPLRSYQLLWLLVVCTAWALATIYWKPFKPFWSHIRQDWTYLSYCTFALVLIVSSTVDRDETPRLNFLVLLPSLLTLAGALIHLRSTNRTGRILALVGSLTFALPVQYWPVLDGMMGSPIARLEVFIILGGMYVLLLAFLLAPALISLLKRANPTGNS